MGPDNSTPVTLYYVDHATGKATKLGPGIPELTLTNGGDEIVSCCRMCISCYHADRKREHDGRVRCTRWSRWVDPEAKPCEEYSDFTQEQYDELRKMLGIPGDKSE